VREAEDGSLVVRQASEVSGRAGQFPETHADLLSDDVTSCVPPEYW